MTETSTRQNTASWLRRALRIAAPALLVVLLAAPAFAARIVQVRVGNHPTFSRVVFELDAHAGFQIENREVGGSKILVVTIDASSRDRDVISKSLGVGAVSIEAEDGKSVALVTLRRDDLLVKEMILSNPPRIVLDFEYTGAKVASSSASPAPTSKAPTKSATQTSTKPVARPTPSPTPIAKAPEPVRVVPAPPKPVVAKPIALPEAKVAKVIEQPAPIAAAEPSSIEPAVAPAMLSASDIEKDFEKPAGSNDLMAGMKAAVEGSVPTPIPTPKVVDELAEAPLPQPIPTAKKMPTPTRSAAADGPRPVAKSSQPAAEQDSSQWMFAAAGGVLLLAGIVFLVMRRRSIPNDLDVTALSDELADSPVAFPEPMAAKRDEAEPTALVGGRIPDEGFEMTQPAGQPAGEPAPASDETMVMSTNLFDKNVGESDGGLTDSNASTQVSEANTAAYSLSEVSANSEEPGTGLFDDDPEGEKQMDMESTDLPAQHVDLGAAPTAAAASGDSELSSMVQEMMTRLGTLEARLEESNEAREQLERQVAAQSEELRVQRAAIARTQRALRSLSRTEEDQATEPALKTPSA